MGLYKYVTNRTIPNKAGRETGRVRMMVKSGSDTAEVEYTCSECLHQGKISQYFQRPLAVKCQKCSFTMKLPKMKKMK